MSAYAAAHNRLIDYAIIADLRGADDAARSLRFAASLLARLMQAERNRHGKTEGKTVKTPLRRL
jgi:hypothetical protein